MRPEAVTVDEQKQILAQDKLAIFAGQTPLSTKLDLYGAMARALRYNVDYRTKLFEKQVALGQYNVSKYKFLPAFRVNGGVNYRSNLPIADSIDTSTNQLTQSFATASDRTIRNADVRMVWNLLDFGITYYKVKQEGNKALMADEARRKVVSGLLRDVRSAYWKAAIAQKVQPQIEHILGEAREALAASSKAQHRGLASPMKVLQYRKTLMKLIDNLEDLYNQMITAKTQLSSLINEPLGNTFELDVPDVLPMDAANVPFCLPKMEELALLNKPEIREEIYRKRISVAETRKATLRMLPGLELSTGDNYSSNSFLHNRAWATASAQVTWNIFNVLSGPAMIKHSKMQEAVADQRRMAIQMAVLTKVHLAYRDYLHRRYQLHRSTELDKLEKELTGYIRNAAQKRAKSRLELIQAEVSELSSGLKRDNAYSAMQDSLGYIYDSMGVDPLPSPFNKVDISDLRNRLAFNLGTWTKAETAPFNWACYAPNREDQSYDPSNFRIAKKDIQKAITEATAGKASSAETDKVAEFIADKVIAKMGDESTESMPEVVPLSRVEVPVKEAYSDNAVEQAQAVNVPNRNESRTASAGKRMYRIPFGINPHLASDAIAVLNQPLAYLLTHPETHVDVIGFSDNRGTRLERYNISLKRARLVSDYLVQQGVKAAQLSVKGYDGNSPIADNGTAIGRAKNRRVELYLSDSAYGAKVSIQPVSQAVAQTWR